MDIKDFNELNALNKLLGTIKFRSDLDFYEFREFAASPIIADIFKRVNNEFWIEAIKRGHIQPGHRPTFEFDSPTGETLRKRIDELTESECETLRTMGGQGVTNYIKNLMTPLQTTEKDFELLLKYADNKIKTIL